jgi:proteasome assembly chaperone (PAC2) family protein
MADLVQVEALPKLRDPVLVVALAGWVDAGIAGAGTLGVLGEQLEAARRFASIDLAEVMDLQQTRPSVELVGGVTRRIRWPEIELVAGRLGRDVVLCAGPEPSLRWQEVLASLVDLAGRLGIVRAFTLAGIPTMASHRRPIGVLATATDDSLLGDLGAWRADYQGPTGAQTALQVMLGEAGIPTVALWAQVPHYLAGSPCPPAVHALLERLGSVGGLAVRLDALDEPRQAYLARVEEGLIERPDVVEVIRAIEEGEEESLPTGDELASEIERFLRGQG